MSSMIQRKKSRAPKRGSQPLTRTTNVSSPALLNGKRMKNFTVKHREYFKTIEATTYEFSESVSLNPGLPSSFPWLSGMAPNFESYTFKSLKFEYVPSCAATTSGALYFAVDYDASDVHPYDKGRLMSFQSAVSTPYWQPATLVCETADLRKFSPDRYVRMGALGANSDIKTYDIGKIHLLSGQTTALINAGALYVSYEVEFHTPQLEPSASYLDSAKITAGAPSKANPFTGLVVEGDEFHVPVKKATDQSIDLLEVGQYLFDWAITGTGLTADFPAFAGATGAGTVTNEGGVFNAGLTSGIYSQSVNVTKPGTFTFTTPAGWTTLTGLIGRMSPYSYVLS